ncbi:MAG: methylglyoxal synthase [Eubacteriales bacterium]|nr:methylglyoxal synthase [Eubacteriales bacterium]
MNIGIIATEDKMLQLENFCTAYRRMLSKHKIYTIDGMGDKFNKLLNTKMVICLPVNLGGINQFVTKIRENGIDIVFFFKGKMENIIENNQLSEVLDVCNDYTIPIATNMATAEILILGLDRGDLSW